MHYAECRTVASWQKNLCLPIELTGLGASARHDLGGHDLDEIRVHAARGVRQRGPRGPANGLRVRVAQVLAGVLVAHT